MAQLGSGREILLAGIGTLTLGALLITLPVSIKSSGRLSKFSRFSLLLLGEISCVVSWYCWRKISTIEAKRWKAEERVIESIKGEEFIEKVAKQIGLQDPSETEQKVGIVSGKSEGVNFTEALESLFKRSPDYFKSENIGKEEKQPESSQGNASGSDGLPPSGEETTSQNESGSGSGSIDDVLDKVRELVERENYSPARAIYQITGEKSGTRQHKKIRDAYRVRYGE